MCILISIKYVYIYSIRIYISNRHWYKGTCVQTIVCRNEQTNDVLLMELGAVSIRGGSSCNYMSRYYIYTYVLMGYTKLYKEACKYGSSMVFRIITVKAITGINSVLIDNTIDVLCCVYNVIYVDSCYSLCFSVWRVFAKINN